MGFEQSPINEPIEHEDTSWVKGNTSLDETVKQVMAGRYGEDADFDYKLENSAEARPTLIVLKDNAEVMRYPLRVGQERNPVQGDNGFWELSLDDSAYRSVVEHLGNSATITMSKDEEVETEPTTATTVQSKRNGDSQDNQGALPSSEDAPQDVQSSSENMPSSSVEGNTIPENFWDVVDEFRMDTRAWGVNAPAIHGWLDLLEGISLEEPGSEYRKDQFEICVNPQKIEGMIDWPKEQVVMLIKVLNEISLSDDLHLKPDVRSL